MLRIARGCVRSCVPRCASAGVAVPHRLGGIGFSRSTQFRAAWTQIQPGRALFRVDFSSGLIRRFSTEAISQRSSNASSKLSLGARISQLIAKYSKEIGIAGYVLLTIQWCMDDLLALRCMGIVCASSFMVFLYFQPTPLLTPVGFNGLFVCINVYFVTRMLMERRDVKLDEIEQLIWDNAFCGFMTKVQMKDALARGVRLVVKEGDIFSYAGRPYNKRVFLIASGQVAQTMNGQLITKLGPGEFCGECQFVERARSSSGRHQTTTSFATECIVFEWETGVLDEYFKARPDVLSKFQLIWAEGLNKKLEARNAKAHERAYADILRGILCSGDVGEAELAFLAHVRKVHSITKECHESTLRYLGYSESDFADFVERGRAPWWRRWLRPQSKGFPSQIAFKPMKAPKWSGKKSGDFDAASPGKYSAPFSPTPASPEPKRITSDFGFESPYSPSVAAKTGASPKTSLSLPFDHPNGRNTFKKTPGIPEGLESTENLDFNSGTLSGATGQYLKKEMSKWREKKLQQESQADAKASTPKQAHAKAPAPKQVDADAKSAPQKRPENISLYFEDIGRWEYGWSVDSPIMKPQAPARFKSDPFHK